MNIIDTILADSIMEKDQILFDGDPVEVTFVDRDREDIDEVFVKGYSHHSGDSVEYTLFADDYYDIWAV